MDSKLRCVFALPPPQVRPAMVTVLMVAQEEANGVEEEAKYAESKVAMEAKPAAPATKVTIVIAIVTIARRNCPEYGVFNFLKSTKCYFLCSQCR